MARERIIVISGELQGTEMEIIGTLSIGRSRENRLQVEDLQISRHHAVIQQSPEGTTIRDLGSGNGTYVGGRRVVEQELIDGDLISVGPLELRYEVVRDEPDRTPESERSVVFSASEDNTVEASAAANVYQTFFRAPQDAQTTEQLREAQARLATVYEATQIISSERNMKKLLGRVMDQLFGLVPAHNGVIMLRRDGTGELMTEYVKTGTGQAEITISSSIVRRASEQGEAVITFNAAADDRFGAGMSIIAQNITSAMCAPLEHQGEISGVLYVDTRGTTNAFKQSDLELIVALARAAAIVLKNAQYLDQVERGFHDTLIVLANAIELRDHYTVGHTARVTRFAMEMARKLGWDEDKIQECEMGGVLHDVGKIAVDNAILGKQGKLTDEEYAKLKVHPERGARLMQDVERLIPLIPYVLYHHERWDGKGYPFGLEAERIPIEGRIVAVADAYDAMTSNRPYRRGLDPGESIDEIQKGSGSQFDPACVMALVQCHQDGSLNKILQNYYEQDGRSIACPFCSTYIALPENAQSDKEIMCNVCHRRLLLKFQNDAWYGERLAETNPQMNRRTAPPGRDTDPGQ